MRPKSLVDRLLGHGGSPDGLGHSWATAKTSGPGSGLEWVPPRTLSGEPSDGVSLALVVAGIVVNGACGAVIGAALSPDKSKRTKYAVVGGLLGGIFGPLGSAGQAVYVMVK